VCSLVGTMQRGSKEVKRLTLSFGARILVVSLVLALIATACGTPAPPPEPPAAEVPQYGGTMILTYENDIATLDPAIGYDWDNWGMEKWIYDALLDYDVDMNMIPHIAEMPEVSADGTVYTFTLREGVKFHNGRELTADDVAYTITRVIDPETMSPGQSFYFTIKGSEEFANGEADSVEGIEVLDDYTIRFTLTQPDASFLNVVALNFSFIVPKEEVEKWGEDFGHHPMGTGPFVFDEWVPGQRLTFVRSEEYFLPELPYLDGVEVQIGVGPDVALLRLEKGEVDYLGDGIPPGEFVRLMEDPAWENRIVHSVRVHTGYIALNTQLAPFDDVRVRRAVNMAIDKDRIIQLLNGRGVPAVGMLPPLMPGYDPDVKGYDYDPEGAQALLAEAGYPDGFSTFIECISVDPEPKLCESFQNDLRQIGIDLEVRTLSPSTVINDAGTPGKVPMVWSGGLAWIQDYPHPSDFYGPILSCDSAVQGGWNWPMYCNPELDARELAARGMSDWDASMEEYQEIFQILLDDAVWVPVLHQEDYNAHSDALHGGVRDFLHPVHDIRAYVLWKSE
jgi:ABC-type transport system substrate-binding protein